MDVDPKQIIFTENAEIIGQEHLTHAPLNVRRAIGAMAVRTAGQEKEWATGERSKSVEIRPYQVDAWAALQNHRDGGEKNALLHMATGLGKTTVAAGDIASFVESRRLRGEDSTRVLFLAHQTELIRQGADRLASLLPDMSVSELSKRNKQKGAHSADIVVATLQSMGNRLHEYANDAFDYVVVDESHHSMAQDFKKTISHFTPEFRLGITATPFRGDEKDLADLFGETVYSKGLEAAIAEEWLVTPDYRLQMDDILDDIVDQKFNSMKELNEVLFSETRNEEVARIINEAETELQRPKTIIFCRDIAHAEETLRFHPDAKTLHSEILSDERAKIMDEFKNGDLSKIITVDMFNEGIDVPEVNMLVFLRSTASRTIFEQQLGRGLRHAPGKDTVIVLDFVGTGERLQDLYALSEEIRKRRSELEPDLHPDVSVRNNPQEEAEKFVRNMGFEFTQHQIDILEYIRQAYEELEDAPEGWIPYKQAALELGVSGDAVRNRLGMLGLEAKRFRILGGLPSLHISPEDMQKLIEYSTVPSGWISITDIADQLELTHTTIRSRLEQLGIESTSYLNATGNPTAHIPFESFEKLKEYGHVPEGWLSFTEMAEALDSNWATISKRVKSLNIETRSYITKSGPPAAHISPEDAQRLHELGSYSEEEYELVSRGWKSVPESAEELELSQSSLRTRIGKLAIEVMKLQGLNNKHRQYISPADYIKIKEYGDKPDDYVTLAEAADALELTYHIVLSRAEQLGLTIEIYLGDNGRPTAHISHDNIKKIEAFSQIDENWVTFAEASEELGISQQTIIARAAKLNIEIKRASLGAGRPAVFLSREDIIKMKEVTAPEGWRKFETAA